MSSCITASVVKFEEVCNKNNNIREQFAFVYRIKHNRIVNSGLSRLPSNPEM